MILQKLIIEGNSKKNKQMLTLRREWRETIEAAAVMTTSFDERELFQFADELSGGE